MTAVTTDACPRVTYAELVDHLQRAYERGDAAELPSSGCLLDLWAGPTSEIFLDTSTDAAIVAILGGSGPVGDGDAAGWVSRETMEALYTGAHRPRLDGLLPDAVDDDHIRLAIGTQWEELRDRHGLTARRVRNLAGYLRAVGRTEPTHEREEKSTELGPNVTPSVAAEPTLRGPDEDVAESAALATLRRWRRTLRDIPGGLAGATAAVCPTHGAGAGRCPTPGAVLRRVADGLLADAELGLQDRRPLRSFEDSLLALTSAADPERYGVPRRSTAAQRKNRQRDAACILGVLVDSGAKSLAHQNAVARPLLIAMTLQLIDALATRWADMRRPRDAGHATRRALQGWIRRILAELGSLTASSHRWSRRVANATAVACGVLDAIEEQASPYLHGASLDPRRGR